MEENYTLLRKKSKPLYSLILNTEIDKDKITPIRAKNGDWTLKIKTLDNKEILTNSKYDPTRGLEKVIENINLEASSIICIGLGLGYEIQQILINKAKATKLVIIEPRLDILKVALEHVDLTEILSSSYTYLLGGALTQITKQLEHLKNNLIFFMTKTPEVYFNSYSLRVYEQAMIQEVLTELRSSIVSFNESIGNSIEDTLLGINHTFSNINELYHSINLSTLNKMYKGYPAICVAAGPSLDKNIEILRKVQDKALIFCADTIYERLLNYGILADGIATIERPKIVYNYFYKGKKDKIDPRTCLLASIVIYPKIAEEYPGPKVFFSRANLAFDRGVARAITSINSTNIGSSCAHVSFAAAKLLECNPIILIGQDLAYSDDGFTHAKGTYNESNTIAKEQEQGIQLLEVTNYNQDGVVKTTLIWDMFRRWFEEQVDSDENTTYINSTGGGAHIRGTRAISLSEVAESYLYTLPDKVPLYKTIEECNVQNNMDSLRQNVNKFVKIEYEKLKKVEKELEVLHQKFSLIDRMVSKRQDKEQLTKAWRKTVEVLESFQKLWEISNQFKQITLAVGIQINQYLISTSVINDVKSFIEYYRYFWNKTVELQRLLTLLKKEYERGVQISRTGIVDTIETPLMEEMYNE